ncbi:hypothetical protein IFO69_05800 [Echinicola sp. CAU 1574]|uniref:Uncharacterized protein n=1 Tax=Echinicola arenosa TaxID=2774144 RepID=A0ABR9AKA3_9BACT|nr:hypothetical protein [Echinicola arenosa]MBD8488253.1 hypothetical protein [Echinicola arenosa]
MDDSVDGEKPDEKPLFRYYPSETGNWESRMARAVQFEDFKRLEFNLDGRLKSFMACLKVGKQQWMPKFQSFKKSNLPLVV